LASPNNNYSEALSAAIANYSKNFADNISQNNALLSYVTKNGNVNTFDGGAEILQNLSYAGSLSTAWYSGAETLNTDQEESLTTANFAIKQAAAHVTFSGRDEMIHAGKSKMHDFFRAKISNAETALSNAIGAALFYSNSEASGKAIGGLQHLVSDTGVGTVGGIDSSANTFWKNYVYDFSDHSATASKDTIIDALDDAYMNVSFGSSVPDLVVAGATYFGFFEKAMREQKMFVDADTAQASFNGYKYKKAVVTYDPNCAATRMYVLNTKFIHFRPHEKRNFITGKAKDSVNQDAYVIPIFWGGNMTVSGRRNQAVIVG
jgi:fructose-specific component phosphotransferase system IIB-like protein